MQELYRKEIIKTLEDLDAELFGKEFNGKISFAVFGGSSILLSVAPRNFRPTSDIDIIGYEKNKPQIINEEILDIMSKYEINNRGQYWFSTMIESVDQESEFIEWQERKFKCIKVFIPSPTVIAATKIVSSHQRAPRDDIEDIRIPEIWNKIDINKLVAYVLEYAKYDIYFDSNQSNRKYLEKDLANIIKELKQRQQ